MTDDPNTPIESPSGLVVDKVSAGVIADRLIELDPAQFSNHQRSLYWDTVGLLTAINDGTLKPGGANRIFNNLVEIVDLFEDNEASRPIVRELHSAILRCAEEGYSIDAEPDRRHPERKWARR
jgi:hypothetical protein